LHHARAPLPFGSGIPSGEQLMLFFALAGGGAFFLFMAFFLFLPVIILAPSKFALSFSLGCCLVLSGFAALKGWRRQAAQMLARDRLPFTAGYLGSVALTLYASIFLGSYLLSLLASGLQVRRREGCGPCVRGARPAGAPHSKGVRALRRAALHPPAPCCGLFSTCAAPR
jgi:hypothetical protein